MEDHKKRIEIDGENYLAKDSEFIKIGDGEFRYVGHELIVEIPKVIKGEEVKSYRWMFKGSKVVKVIANNSKITDISYMFEEANLYFIDLTDFNVPNAKNMRGMFSKSICMTVSLWCFDISKAEDTSEMFADSFIKYLDLDNNNLEDVENTKDMFKNCYCTQLFAKHAKLSGENRRTILRNMENVEFLAKDEMDDLDFFCYDLGEVEDDFF